MKTERATARSKDQVLATVGQIAIRLRQALGDSTPRSAQQAASETFSTASLDAVRNYTAAQELQSSGRYDEAIAKYKEALAADASFGRAYAGWATSAFQMGRQAEAEDLWKKSLTLMDRMSERERYRTLGGYYLGISRDYEQAIKNYSELVRLYPADRAGHSNLALAHFYTLDFAKALEEGRRAVEIYPSSPKFRNNYALYAMYASNFDEAVKEAKGLLAADAKFADPYFPLAISQVVAGDVAAAVESYTNMARLGPSVLSSRAVMGLADIAMYEGRYADAVAILRPRIEQDRKEENTIGIASKSIALAEAYDRLGRQVEARATAHEAARVFEHESVLFPAARVLMANGDMAGAQDLAKRLDNLLQTQTRAYARLINGEIALRQNRLGDAIDAFRAASRQYDAWISHIDLGIAYVRANHSPEAVAEFDLALRRRGEAVALFLDDIPSIRYLAPLAYWHGVAQEGVGMKTAALENYQRFLTLRKDPNDLLVKDARQRHAALSVAEP